jgi:lyso-ornithine lipid O-acyltransferase
MIYFRIFYKLIIFVLFILAYVLTSLFWRIWTRDIVRRRHHYTHTVSFFCKIALWLIQFKVNVIGKPHKEESFLLVGNHLGMLDILVTASQHPTLFVTSVDMRQTPGLGFLTEMGGCLYVERRNRSNITNEIEEIRSVLNQGFSVALYPEGTSSNGEMVLPFKKSLLTAAAGTEVPILPMVVNYRRVNGEPMSDKWRDYVCWYGDQTFFPALIRIFTVHSVEVDIEFLEEIIVHSEEQRREVATRLQTMIESKYTPIVK